MSDRIGDSNFIELQSELHKKRLLYQNRDKKSTSEYRPLKFKRSLDKTKPSASSPKESAEEVQEDEFEKSKASLERKSKLYEILGEGREQIPNSPFLVDFARKESFQPSNDPIPFTENTENGELPCLEKPSKNDRPVFYEDMLGNEIRTHGVSYYKLSVDEQERKTQLKRFEDFERESKIKREERNKRDLERQSALAARLNKVKRRKLAECGLDPELFGGVDTYEDHVVVVEEREKSPEVVVEKPVEPVKVREWDFGKAGVEVDLDRSYLEKRRNKRDPEFAPPKSY